MPFVGCSWCDVRILCVDMVGVLGPETVVSGDLGRCGEEPRLEVPLEVLRGGRLWSRGCDLDVPGEDRLLRPPPPGAHDECTWSAEIHLTQSLAVLARNRIGSATPDSSN